MNLSFKELVQLSYQGLRAANIRHPAAADTALFLALAEVDGLASHGLARVAQYSGHAKNDRINIKAAIQTRHHKAASALVDAQDGLAFPALKYATDLSVKLAQKVGVGLVAVKNTHHFGVAGHYTEAAARAGYVSILLGNTPAAMPMVGGKKAVFGTNPLAVAFPLPGKDPLVIDMSLSAVARGKLLVASKKGESIPLGWALTAEGKPTTDPNEGLQGLMLPLGGDKGALLALMIELLAVGLSGSHYSYEADSFFALRGNKPRLGQLIITIDPGLPGKGVYRNRIFDLLTRLSEDVGVRLPGYRRFAQRQQAMQSGVLVNEAVIQEIKRGIESNWNH
jgi:(2R)-3-sulfolactate dehydrogenase (NADP+)